MCLNWCLCSYKFVVESERERERSDILSLKVYVGCTVWYLPIPHLCQPSAPINTQVYIWVDCFFFLLFVCVSVYLWHYLVRSTTFRTRLFFFFFFFFCFSYLYVIFFISSHSDWLRVYSIVARYCSLLSIYIILYNMEYIFFLQYQNEGENKRPIFGHNIIIIIHCSKHIVEINAMWISLSEHCIHIYKIKMIEESARGIICVPFFVSNRDKYYDISTIHLTLFVFFLLDNDCGKIKSGVQKNWWNWKSRFFFHNESDIADDFLNSASYLQKKHLFVS